MRINKHNFVNFGILKKHVVKSNAIGDLHIFNGETSKSTIRIFKEYIRKQLDLKYYYIEDKYTGEIRSRLQHIYKNNVIRERNN